MIPVFQGVPRCAHCDSRAVMSTTHAEGLRPNAGKKFVWACRPCGATVGCHQVGSCCWIPLGRPANSGVRLLRMRLHEEFDPIWRFGDTTRKSAYRWLASEMKINPSDCHIGMFDERQCRQALEHVQLRVGDPMEGVFDDLVDS